MILVCPTCSERYDVEDKDVWPGLSVSCATCRQAWTLSAEHLSGGATRDNAPFSAPSVPTGGSVGTLPAPRFAPYSSSPSAVSQRFERVTPKAPSARLRRLSRNATLVWMLMGGAGLFMASSGVTPVQLAQNLTRAALVLWQQGGQQVQSAVMRVKKSSTTHQPSQPSVQTVRHVPADSALRAEKLVVRPGGTPGVLHVVGVVRNCHEGEVKLPRLRVCFLGGGKQDRLLQTDGTPAKPMTASDLSARKEVYHTLSQPSLKGKETLAFALEVSDVPEDTQAVTASFDHRS